MKISHILLVFVLVLILAGVGAYVYYTQYSDHAKLIVSDASKSLMGEGYSYMDMSGNPVDMSSFIGKPVLVNSWASWCPFCKEELPHLNTLAAEFKDSGLVVLAINRAESTNTIVAYMDYIGKPENITFLQDPNDVFYKSTGGFAMPETIFYSKSGKEVGRIRGSQNEDDLRASIKVALEQE